ncbi:11533_t:CDS:2, partial [Diversispora eburnea]
MAVSLFFNTKYTGLNIKKVTISKIWKDRQKWLAILSNSQTSQTFLVAAGLPISDMILKEKGLEFVRILNIEDKLKCANGWIYKFKLRNELQKFNFSGEVNSAPLNTLLEECTNTEAIAGRK